MTTIAAIVLCIAAIALGRIAWRHRLNPITIGALVWSPALVLASIPREFLSPVYDYLNHTIGLGVFAALILGFVGFSAGVLTVMAFTGKRCWSTAAINQYKVNIHEGRLVLLFALGLAVYLYAFQRAGLGDVLNLEPDEVAESRLSLHLGPLSFAVLFIDVGAIVFMARMFETGRYLYGAPMLVALTAHMATLHKSPTMFLALSSLFLCLLYPRQARDMTFGTPHRALVSTLIATMIALSLLVMNALRGIGIIQMTTFEWTWFEQVYIYSGGTAILDLSAAIKGLVPNDPPTFGLVLAKPITWHIVDRGLLNPTRHFGGINAATYLIYPWSDFRWIGFIVTPFLTGALIVAFFRLALRKTVYGLMLGAIAFKAVIFSPNTDVLFDPTTTIVIAFAVLAHLVVRKRKRTQKARPGRLSQPAQTH